MLDIKKMRNDLRLDQTQFADEIHTTQTTISSLERGTRKISFAIYDAIVARYGKEFTDKYRIDEEAQTINIVQQKSTSSGNSTNYGVGNNTDPNLIDVLKKQSDVLSEQSKQISKFQEQIDRLLNLMEKEH